MSSFTAELAIYVGRARQFSTRDWLAYGAWVGLMTGLCVATGGFLLFGAVQGVHFPAEAWLVPIGALVFSLSIALDTIGHRTIYLRAIEGAEGLVHSITIFCGIGSCILLCAAYSQRQALWIPALVLTFLSFVYSFIDEGFHWRRYVREQADRVEMTSHVGILSGHLTMMIGWWVWFWRGYPGVAETVRALSALG
jgi:hypothetical protein